MFLLFSDILLIEVNVCKCSTVLKNREVILKTQRKYGRSKKEMNVFILLFVMFWVVRLVYVVFIRF